MRYLTLLLLLAFEIGVSQNVVPNFSFESSRKQERFSTIKDVHQWFSPNQTTPDYVDLKDGFSMGFYLYSVDPENREYISVKLNQALEDSTYYRIDIKMRLRGDNRFANGFVSAWLSHDKPQAEKQQRLDTVPQVTMASPYLLPKTGQWFNMVDTFSVTGGQQYLTIGNFFPDRRTPVHEYSDDLPKRWNHAYIFVDEVTIERVEREMLPEVECPFPNDTTWYPEPTFDLYIDYSCSCSDVERVVPYSPRWLDRPRKN